jgi:hypothetical protein
LRLQQAFVCARPDDEKASVLVLLAVLVVVSVEATFDLADDFSSREPAAGGASARVVTPVKQVVAHDGIDSRLAADKANHEGDQSAVPRLGDAGAGG